MWPIVLILLNAFEWKRFLAWTLRSELLYELNSRATIVAETDGDGRSLVDFNEYSEALGNA